MIRHSLILLVCLTVLGCQSAVRYRAQRQSDEMVTRSVVPGELQLFVRDWLGTPYKMGGQSKAGIDCSGFTSLAYQQCYNKKIPRVSEDQFYEGRKVEETRLRPGDLVFFNNVRYGKIDHVGIYLGDDQFAHATESEGITISSLNEDYYHLRYFGACRY